MVPLVIIVLLFLSKLCVSNTQPVHHTNFVIVGGTGDLARKYLWSSALRLFVENYNENTTFSFFAGARVSQTDGDKALNEILDSNKCEVNDQKCHKLRPKFIENSKYVVLKYEENYTNLCEKFRSTDDSELSVHQIFYLSIPSSAYESVSHNIHTHCRHEKFRSTKVVLEKPFGLNKESAVKQANIISEHFHDDEVHRVDHYLAKSVSKQILNFR